MASPDGSSGSGSRATGSTTVTGTRTMKLPTFSGGTEKDEITARDFVERIEAHCRVLNKTENDACNEMHLVLRGNAANWWRTLARRDIDPTNWTQVKKEFLDTYATKLTGHTAHAIGQLEQRVGESPDEYFGRLDQVIEDMVTDYPDEHKTRTSPAANTWDQGYKDTFKNFRNYVQKYLYIGGLRENLRADVLKANPSTLVDALKEARKSNLIATKQKGIFSVDEENTNKTEEDLDLTEEEIHAINQRRAKFGRKPFNTQKKGPIKCYNCNKLGHIARNCNQGQRRNIRSIEEGQETQHNDQIQSIHGQDFW